MSEITSKVATDELTLDEEINALIAKAVREGISDSEFARFQHLTAHRSMIRRPRPDKRVGRLLKMSHAY